MGGMGGDIGSWLDFDDIERWAAEARARDAVDARQRERWLRRQAEDEAAFASLLLGLAERRVAAIVTTTGGRHHVGRIEAVGADFAALGAAGGRITMVSLAAVAAVRVADAAEARRHRDHRRSEPAADARPDHGERTIGVVMSDVIGHAVERRPRVQVFAGGAQLGGELRAVGADVVTLHTDGDPPGLLYVRLASVSEFSFLDSG